MERNGCRHRRSDHWRSSPLTIVSTWTVASTIAWIDLGLCVAGIYRYVDTDFAMKSRIHCTFLRQHPCEVSLAHNEQMFCSRPSSALTLASRSLRMAAIDASHPPKKQRTEGPKVRVVRCLFSPGLTQEARLSRSLGLTMAPFIATKLLRCTCYGSRRLIVMQVTLHTIHVAWRSTKTVEQTSNAPVTLLSLIRAT